MRGWISSQAENSFIALTQFFDDADDYGDDDNDADEEDGCLVGQKICVCPNPRTLLRV